MAKYRVDRNGNVTVNDSEEKKKKKAKYSVDRNGNVTVNAVEDDDIGPVRADITKAEDASTINGRKLQNLFTVFNNEDFKEKSGYISTKADRFWDKLSSKYGMGYNDLQYEYINNQSGLRDEIEAKAFAWGRDTGQSTSSYKEKALDYMTADEVAVYNYYYQTEGKDKAQEFLDALAETLGTRKAEKTFSNMQGKTGREILYGIPAGAEQFRQGVKNFGKMIAGKDDYIPQTATQILTGMVREDLADDGFKVLGNSVGQVAFDALNTGTNMVPSIAVGAINPVAGAALMGSSAAGNAYQQDLSEGNNKDEAKLYATTIGVLEGSLQYALGGIGKLGGMSSTISRAVSGIKNGALKFALEYGGKIGAEALEEGLQEVLDPLVKNAIHGTKENVDWNNVAYSALLGGLMGAGFGAGEVSSSHLSKNETAVIDKVYKDLVAEEAKKAKDGNVSQAKKNELYDQAVAAMDKGYIATDTIEEILGGEDFKAYQEAQAKEESVLKELEGLYQGEELAAQQQSIRDHSTLTQLRQTMGDKVAELVKGDRLAESYREKGRRSQVFQADVSQYDEKQRAIVQKAIDSGVLNNTNRSHELVDLIAKVGADKALDFDFTNNEKLKASGFALNGKTVNGYVSGSGVTVNINSAKALNSVVGHEITHVLEGTGEFYTALESMVTEYAKSKGEYNARLTELRSLYADVEGYKGADGHEKIKKELVADLVGDYIFTDTDFISRLSTENRSVFEKIYDELKYLCRVATAGSKEHRQLEKAKKAFEDAYRQDAKNTADDGGVRYSLSKNAKSELHKALYDKTYEGEVLLRDVTPGIMLSHDGVKNLPMTMNASHIRENVFTEEDAGKLGLKVDKHTHYHGLGEDFFLKVIDGLDNVKEAYRGTKNADEPSRRENYFLLVSEFLDQKGNTVNVPVYVNEHGQVNRAFIDVNKISTVFGRDNFRDYINRQIQQKNLVRIKNRSTQSSESNALIAKDYRQDASESSIREIGEDVNKKFSISSQEDMFPVRKDLEAVRGNIYGKDVELDLGPVREDLNAAGEQTADPYDDLPFDMPENLEEGQLSDAELEEDEQRNPITTVAERLGATVASLRQELQTNEQNRQASADAYDQKIEELQQRYDAKPKKHTKAANAILRQIAKQKQLKAQRDAEFEKRINDIKKKISKTRELMKWDHTREDQLEQRIRQVDEQLEADKQALDEEFRERRAHAESLADKDSYFSSEARILLDEILYHKKGTGFSADILKLRHQGHSYTEIKKALRTVEQNPEEMKHPNWLAEQNVRKLLEERHKNAVYDADEVETDYQRRLKTLNDDAEAMRAAVRKASEGITRKQLHSDIVENIRTEFTNRGYDLDEVLKNAKNLATFTTVDSTPQRVMERALGYKEGGVLADLTVNKVAQNETEGIKWLNSFTDRKNGVLAQLSKKYGIKPGSNESAAAQMYAEGFFVNEKDEIVRYGDPELLQDFPDQKVRENIKGLARDPLIRRIYDETLDSLNESRRRNAYAEIQKLDNYFLHFRAMDDTFSKLGLPFNPNDIRAKDLPTDLNGVTADLKPGQPYFSSAMHRKGKRTSFDLLGGLERYLISAKNQIYHIDDIQTLRALRNYIADIYGQANGLEDLDYLGEEEAQELIKQKYSNHLSTFAKFLNEEANVIAGKTSLIDRGLEGIIGRRGITFLNDLNRQVGSNMVGYNLSSAGTNVIPVIQAFAKSNKYDFVKATAQTAYYRIGKLAKIEDDGFRENSPVVIRRKGADRFYRTPWQKIADPGYAIMGAVDDVSTEIIARAKYNELTRKGMDPKKAHFETDKWVSRLMGDRSVGQMPHLFNSKTLGLITKFQLEGRNQLDSQFYDTIQEEKVSAEQIQDQLERNKRIAARVTSTFVQLAVLQHLFGKLYEEVAGYNPVFDIVEVLIKTLGYDDEEDSEDTAIDNVEQGFLTLMEDMPYTGVFLDGGRIPISSALPIGQLIKGEDQYGNEKPRLETLLEALPYYLLPGGYGQAKKTIKGLSMFFGDKPISGSYTSSGNLRFPVAETPLSIAQAAVFGQWANENARTYIDEGRSPIPESQIQEYLDSGLTYDAWWERKDELKKVDNEFEANEQIAAFRQVMEQVENTAADALAGKEDLLKEKFLRSAADELSDIKSEMKELVSMPLADVYKERQMQSLQEKANGIAQSAMDAYGKVEFDGDYARVGEKVWKHDEDSDWRRLTGEALTKYQVTSASESDVYATDGTNHYRWYEPGEDAENPEPGWRKVSKKELERQNAVTAALGITPEEYWGDRREEYSYAYENPEKYLITKAVGGYDAYKAYNDKLNDIKADKDKDGKSIGGSRKGKVIKYINTLDAAYGEKLILFKSVYPADDTYNQKIVEYLYSRKDLTKKEIETILKELDFKVGADGTVSW